MRRPDAPVEFPLPTLPPSFIKDLQDELSQPSVKQHLAALRMAIKIPAAISHRSIANPFDISHYQSAL
jgi:hypothetical protein